MILRGCTREIVYFPLKQPPQAARENHKQQIGKLEVSGDACVIQDTAPTGRPCAARTHEAQPEHVEICFTRMWPLNVAASASAAPSACRAC